ncbi:divalent-cation tolerance protein CutA [Candidatus Saccharibacteria bacterium]|nr:divalent-cation tolerance protein CutA [Candidatus Saccharibacteria bacterium]
MSSYCHLWLSCRDTVEADTVSKTLLNKKLVACVKQFPISSDFRWQSGIEHNNEVMLVMDSRVDLFDEVENEISKLHSYEVYVLQAVPVVRVSKEAEKWLGKELKNE